MDQYFNQMEKIIKERKTTSRIRFMLQDVLDLRRVNNKVAYGLKELFCIYNLELKPFPQLNLSGCRFVVLKKCLFINFMV